jgi:tetratricopeptide (TPR) repeat protein
MPLAWRPTIQSLLFGEPRGWTILLLFCATLTAYLPAILGGFVFDDGIYVTQNEKLRSLDAFPRLWSEPTASAYHPLVFTTFWIEYRLWELHPLGYHLVNVFLHFANSLLVGTILLQLGLPGASLAAFLFALHPVHVESVAWISERKDVLSGLFFLLTIAVWLRFEETQRWTNYGAALLLFACALLAKSSTCMLPLGLPLLTWLRRGTVSRREIFLLSPFIPVSAMAGGLYWWVERNYDNPFGPDFEFGWVERCLIAGRAVWFYLWKLVVPFPLMPIYPRWVPDTGAWWQYLFPLGVVAVLGGLWAWNRRVGRGPFVAAAYFVLMLLPAIGFINFAFLRFAFVADHFQYLASIGPLAAFSAWAARQCSRCGGKREGISLSFMAAWLVALGALTFWQGFIYKDDISFWRHNVRFNPASRYPHDHLGQALFNAVRFSEAELAFREGLKILPQDPNLHFSLARVLAQQGKEAEGMRNLEEAIRLDPDFSNAHRNLAVYLASKGRTADARNHFEEAIRTNPSAEAFNDFGVFLQNLDERVESLAVFEKGIEAGPNYAPLHFNRAVSLAGLERYEESFREFDEALRLSPEEEGRIKPVYAQARSRFGLALREEGKLADSVAQFEEAIRLYPRSGDLKRTLEETKRMQNQ